MNDDESLDGAQVPNLESSLREKTEIHVWGPAKKESDVRFRDSPEGGFTGWATAFGAYVQTQQVPS